MAGAWTAAGRPAGSRGWFGEALLFAAIGALADVDLLFGVHSGPTHSIGAAVIAGMVAWVLVRLIVVLDAATASAVRETDPAVRRPASPEGYPPALAGDRQRATARSRRSPQDGRRTEADSGSGEAGEGGSVTRGRKADPTPDGVRPKPDATPDGVRLKPDTTPHTTTGAVRLKANATRLAVGVAAAWASHVMLDWLGEDTSAPFGVMALWPFSREHFMSPVAVMPAITRRYWLPGFWMQNFRALLFELAVLLPVLAAVWIARRKELRIRN